MACSKAATWRRIEASARSRVAVEDRLEQLAVLVDGILELGDAVESEEPDPQGEDVVLLERAREERVVGAGRGRGGGCAGRARSAGARRRRPRQLLEQCDGARRDPPASGAPRRAARRTVSSARRTSERPARSPTLTGATKTPRRGKTSTSVARERAQRLAHRRAAESEALHQLALVDEGAGRELERARSARGCGSRRGR